MFTAAHAAQLLANNLKVSADGPVSTHNDVETILPALGEILEWNGSNWTNVERNVGTTPAEKLAITANTAKISADGSINTHSDVETSNPQLGDLLAWNGLIWVNIPAIVGITPQQSADIMTNLAKISADGPVSTHSDVETTTPVTGDVLRWNGINWVNAVPLLPIF